MHVKIARAVQRIMYMLLQAPVSVLRPSQHACGGISCEQLRSMPKQLASCVLGCWDTKPSARTRFPLRVGAAVAAFALGVAGFTAALPRFMGGAVVRCDLLRNGAIEVEFANAADAERASKIRSLIYTARAEGRRSEKSFPVTVETPEPRTLTRGVVTCGDLRDMDDEEIAEGLADVGVTEARRIGKTDTVVLSFSTPTLPDRIFICYRSISVRRYIPDPLRCFTCHSFGHSSKTCRRGNRCANVEPRITKLTTAHRRWKSVPTVEVNTQRGPEDAPCF